MKYPFDDNEMMYDYKKHRYVLTRAGVEERLKIVLADELNTTGSANAAAEVNVFLDDVSADVYTYVYDHAQNRLIAEYIMAKDPFVRDAIKEAMILQTRYLYINGNIADEAGIDFTRGVAMPLEEIRGERRMSKRARDELANAGLLYTGARYVNVGRFREDY